MGGRETVYFSESIGLIGFTGLTIRRDGTQFLAPIEDEYLYNYKADTNRLLFLMISPPQGLYQI